MQGRSPILIGAHVDDDLDEFKRKIEHLQALAFARLGVPRRFQNVMEILVAGEAGPPPPSRWHPLGRPGWRTRLDEGRLVYRHKLYLELNVEIASTKGWYIVRRVVLGRWTTTGPYTDWEDAEAVYWRTVDARLGITSPGSLP